MMTARAEELLDTPLLELSDADIRELATELPAEWAYLCARVRNAAAEQLTPASNAVYLDLVRRYPRTLDYYREHAEDARWRRLDLKWRARAERLTTSVPFSVIA